MGRAPTGGATAFRFTQREVAEMEKALDSSKGSTPARSVVLSLADNFSSSEERAGQKPIQWKQVWNWFQNRRHSQKAKIGKTPEKSKAPAAAAGPDTLQPKKVPASSGAVSSGASNRNDSQQMEFEAKSARDGAWYDVATFISHRVAASNDPEVRVRFAGFGSEEDEWVNVRSAVRQRSLPCEASECVAVLPGDLILCFQEGNEQALYFDADILDVQRRRHDVRGCRCRFWVRYRHDQAEEVVPLRKVCRRPETEYRLQKLQSIGKSAITCTDGLQQQSGSKGGPPIIPGNEIVFPATTSVVTSSTSEAPAPTAAAAPPVHSGLSTGTTELSAVPGGVSAVSSGTTALPAVPSAGPSIPGGAPPGSVPSVTSVVDATRVETGVTTNPSESQPGSIQNEGLMEEITKQAPTGVSGGDAPSASVDVIMEKVKQVPLNEGPSLVAQPEMFDDQTESIVVLEKSDLEGISKS